VGRKKHALSIFFAAMRGANPWPNAPTSSSRAIRPSASNTPFYRPTPQALWVINRVLTTSAGFLGTASATLAVPQQPHLHSGLDGRLHASVTCEQYQFTLLLQTRWSGASAGGRCILTNRIEGIFLPGRPTVSCREAGSIKREYGITDYFRSGELNAFCADSKLKLWYHWSYFGSAGTPARRICKAFENHQC
jgi:hypothetical protein